MRLKIIAGNFVVVLLLGVVSYFYVGSTFKAALSDDIDSKIGNDQELFDRSFRYAAMEFTDQVAEKALRSPVKDIFSALDQAQRRTRAYDACESVAAWFGDPARGRRGAPDLVVITDEAGKVLARNADRNRMFDEPLGQRLATLAAVLQQNGDATHDVWLKADEGKILQIGIAPIRNESGGTIGALVVAYDLSNGLAKREGETLGRDVAFIVNGKVYSSSFTDTGRVEALKSFLFSGAGKPSTDVALADDGRVSTRWTTDLGGDEYVGVTAPLPLSPSTQIGYVVLANRTARLERASSVNVVLILTVLALLSVIVYGFFIGTALLRPIEQIEEGVLAVINGRTDLRLDVESEELGGLAYRINQLLNVFTGVSEAADEDAEGRVSRPPEPSDWKDAAFNDASGGGGGSGAGGVNDVIDDPALAAQLSAEAEDAYYGRIYREYVAAKQALGENVGNIPQDRFTQRLKANEAALVQKHGCRMVRFQVQTKDRQVILRPVVIR